MNSIINFCPTGMIPTKSMTPFVPISPNEIIEQTHEAFEIGITIAHLHARDEEGVPTYKASIYQQIFEGIRKYCPGLLVCASTSGRNFSEFEKRSEVMELYPDMCSLTLSSLNFMKSASVNSPDMIDALLTKMIEFGITPELECFDLGMINFGKYLIKKKGLQGPNYWNLLFNNIAGFQPNLQQVGLAVNEVPDEDWVALAGIGDAQLSMSTLAISQGLGVRIGLEDNIWFDKNRKRLASNADLLRRVHKILEMHERSVLPSKELGFYNKRRWEKVES